MNGCFKVNLRTADFKSADLHRFVNCDFNSEFKNRNSKNWRFT